MRFFLLSSLFLCAASSYAASVYEDQLEKRSGDTIRFSIDCPDKTLSFKVYRKTGVTSTPSKVADIAASSRQLDYVMPSGTTKQYRFFAVPVDASGVAGPSTNEILIVRVK